MSDRSYVVKVWRVGDGGVLIPEGDFAVEAPTASSALFRATGLAIGAASRVERERKARLAGLGRVVGDFVEGRQP